ncbi:MAG: sugar phosphate isomerase/epimerase family protein [Sphaerochaetaceae bacterium]|nr:sugar phosphate isomerase/epimerase family protein [Sphaerochaetaceae bacterium]
MQYSQPRTITEKIELAKQIDGIDGLELCYPGDFSDAVTLRKMMEDSGLGISAINVRSRRTDGWYRGSFTSEKVMERNEFVDGFKKAVDIAKDFGVSRLTTCPLNDGHDYPFEMDYLAAYEYAEECFQKIVEHDSETNICIEYKLNDPRTRCFFASAGEALSFCQNVGAPNLGVTLDVGHSLLVGERPAQAASMLWHSDRLFYMHMNDNDRLWDWDMVPGAFHINEIVEFYYALGKMGCDDCWMAFDICPKENDVVSVFSLAARVVKKLEALSRRIDQTKMDAAMKRRNPIHALETFYEGVLGMRS